MRKKHDLFDSEVNLAKFVISYLKTNNWEIFQEVKHVNSTADIVLRKNNIIHIIECKTSLTLSVLAQAYRWKDISTFSSIAVPRRKRGYDESVFIRMLCKQLQIGYFEIYEYVGVTRIRSVVSCQPNESADISQWDNILKPEHINSAPAGTDKGGGWTEYRETCKNVYHYVLNNNGCTINDILANIKHHYASKNSARSALIHRGVRGHIPKIQVIYDGQYKFYIEDDFQ